METLESIRRRMETANDLHGIVRTMRALAMTSIRQYERAVESLADYNRATELGLHVALSQAAIYGATPLQPSRKPVAQRRTGIIVLGTDQGMCGQFNEQIVTFTQERLDGLKIPQEKRFALAVGARVAGLLEERGQPLRQVYAVPTSVAAITPSVQEILVRYSDQVMALGGAGLEQVFLFHHRMISTSVYRPHFVRLLPINAHQFVGLKDARWPTPSLPMTNLPWQDLLSALLGQQLFVVLFRAFAESLASENAARLMAMQTAERNIEERLAELTGHYHRQRQNNITGELLDIVAGFEALKKE
jgi:F-type H+-transporting ATPase subunit gamma